MKQEVLLGDEALALGAIRADLSGGGQRYSGVPTFRRSDIAVKFLRKYINNRLKIRKQYEEA